MVLWGLAGEGDQISAERLPVRVSLFIASLATGGAERQLSILAEGLSERGHDVRVVTLFPGGNIADDLKQNPKVELRSLWPKKGRNIFVRLFQLACAPLILRNLLNNETCLYSMLEVTNFIAWLATRFKRNAYLVWGIRSSNMEGHWKMALFDKLCAFISPDVELLIANSHAGLECLLERGYRPKRNIVISNGIDTEKFQYNEESRRRMRDELGVFSKQLLIGIVGRLNPMKDHSTFLNAAALVAKEIDNVKFVCVGGGSNDYAKKLHALAKELGLTDRVIWLGDRRDMVSIYSALDILVSSSCGEGFSNVIGEAMSCGVPCVVTDVGDSAMIVEVSTQVVETRNPEKLAQAICNTLRRKTESNLVEISRIRIKEKYSLKILIDTTEQKLGEIACG